MKDNIGRFKKGCIPWNKGKKYKLSLSEERKNFLKERMMGNKNPSKNPETRKKISVANSGRHRSEEIKRKISESRKGKYVGDQNPFSGKHHSEETRRKISESNKGKLKGNRNPNWIDGLGKIRAEANHRKLGFEILPCWNVEILGDYEYHHIAPGISPYVIPVPNEIHQKYKGKTHVEQVNKIMGINL